MVALMRSEETREAEGFITALMDCTYFLEEYEGILDDHPDRIADATVIQAGHTLRASVSTTTTWISSPSWRRREPSTRSVSGWERWKKRSFRSTARILSTSNFTAPAPMKRRVRQPVLAGDHHRYGLRIC